MKIVTQSQDQKARVQQPGLIEFLYSQEPVSCSGNNRGEECLEEWDTFSSEGQEGEGW